MTDISAPSAASSRSDRFLPLLLVLFIGSGCAALIYEIVWYQMLQLVIGLTTISLGLLLGSFMGGMCVGSLALSRLVKRNIHPLRVYALLELGIGAIGLLELKLMPAVGDFYSSHAGGHDYWNIIARGVVAAICLVPPTLLMGATLPAIARYVRMTPSGVSWLGFFYGGNIVGAVFGCLLAGFYLLRVHDMAYATEVAAGINATVAVLAFGLATLSPVKTAEEEPSSETAEKISGAWAIYVCIALSGLTALGAEVIWTRLISLLLGGTVYTFSIILAVFLFGLGVGSSVGSFASRARFSPRVALGVCQMLLVAAVAWTAYNISRSIPYWPINPELIGDMKNSQGDYVGTWYVFQLDLAVTAWAILPAAVLWGASFPLALAAVAVPGKDPGRLVGGVYAANTIGAIFGAIFFSIYSVPQWGTQDSQRIIIGLAALSTFLALAPLMFNGQRSPRTTGAPAPAGLTVTILLVLTLIGAPLLGESVQPGYWGAVAYGRKVATYNGYLMDGLYKEVNVPMDGSGSVYCLYTGEGLNGTVAVTKTGAGVRSFHSAGKVQASNDPRDMRLQRMLGHISALTTDKEPESVLVVACGAGVTAGSFLMHPSVKKITICDIEPLVPTHVTPMFSKENYGITDDIINHNPAIVHTPSGDKTVEVIFDDGRHYLRTLPKDVKFDVITSDPIDPWVKGCAALNTVEYYQMCKDHLNPGGVMSLWIPFYESNDETAKSVLGTFFQVFPNGLVWSNDYTGDGYDAVLYGKAEPTKIDLDALQDRLNSPRYEAVKQSLSDAGFPTMMDLLGTYAGRATDMQRWLAGAKINDDSNLRLQYIAGMALNTYHGEEVLHNILADYKFPDDMFTGSTDLKAAVRQAIEIPGRTPNSSSVSTTGPNVKSQ